MNGTEAKATGQASSSSVQSAPTAVVLAAHGAPPTDYPRLKVGVLLMLEYVPNPLHDFFLIRRWRERLARDVRQRPRVRETDPYKYAVEDLASALSARLGLPVVAGYNEFCGPTVDEAIEGVIRQGARRVIVVPTMLLRGNTHTESEILQAILEVRRRHAGLEIEYAWPFSTDGMVDLYARHVADHLDAG